MRRTFLLLFAISFAAGPALRSQSFESLLARIMALPAGQKQAVVDSFMSANQKFPLADNDTTLFFIDQRSASAITVPGDANNWDPAAFPMTLVGGTNLWYCKKNFQPDSRLDYKFVVNGSTWILDPRNSLTVTGGFGPNSELRMPRYVAGPEYEYSPGIPHGVLHDTTFTSAVMKNSRAVRVYTPPGYEASRDSFPVILFHDGLEYVTLAQANNTIDYLIWKQRITPIIAVFVPPVNRTAEYASGQMISFSEFIAKEVMPAVDARYRTKRNPAARAVLGASNGGNISLYLGFYHSGVFGNVGAQSSNIISSLSQAFQSNPKLNLKLYLDIGSYDIPVLIPMVRNFVPILQAKGYLHRFREVHEGHSWGNWRGHLGEALEYFFASGTTGVQEYREIPFKPVLKQNFPNPYNPTTTIHYELSADSFVTLRVFDALGRALATLVDGEREAGDHNVRWDASAFPSGVYFYQLSAGAYRESKSMILLR